MDQRTRIAKRDAERTGDWSLYAKRLERVLGYTDEEAVVLSAPAAIAEEDGIHKEWYAAAEKGVDSVDRFLSHLMEHEHDYGTICHAVIAAGLAAMHKVSKDPEQGGITGAQSGIISMLMLRAWQGWEGPLKLLNFDSMLYPQHADQFTMEMSEDTLAWLKGEAIARLSRNATAHQDVRNHWKQIIQGQVPFGWRVE